MDNRDSGELIIDDGVYETRLTKKFLSRTRYQPKDPKKVCAFIPGVIQVVRVKPGQKLKWGDGLLILEAMKMQNDVTCPVDGTVKDVYVRAGQMVTKGQLLLDLE